MCKDGGFTKVLRGNADKILRKKKGNYKNSSTGDCSKLTKNGIEKLTSGKALGKSLKNGFTVYQHMEAASRITSLYKKSFFIKTENDRHGRKDVFFKKYECNFKFKNGKKARAYITIMNTRQNGDTFYSVELLK